MFRRSDPAFVVFEVLALEGCDLRARPLIERKKVLRRLIPRRSPFILYADHIEARGCDFFRLVCARDLEGIVREVESGALRPDAPLSSATQGIGLSYSSVSAASERSDAGICKEPRRFNHRASDRLLEQAIGRRRDESRD